MAQPFNFTFGQDFFNAYQQSQRQKEEERQFNLKFGEEQRQRSLLDAFKQKQYELDINKYNLDVSQEKRLAENTIADNLRLAEGLKLREEQFNQSMDLKEKSLEEKQKYNENILGFKRETLDLQQRLYDLKKDKAQKEPSDFAEPSLVGDIEGTFATLKGMSGNADDPAKTELKANLIAKTESLMEASGLTEDVNHIWDIVKKGGDVEKAINIAALARKKSFTPKQRSYLKLYFKTRNPK